MSLSICLTQARRAVAAPASSTLLQVRGYQKGIHPRLYDVRVVNPDGSTYMTKSTLNLGIYYLADESKNTPSWKKPEVDPSLRDKSGSVERFLTKYGDLGDIFGTGDVDVVASPPPPPAAAAAAPKKGKGKGKK